jgi:mevalonate pyrophosphate decarboxylase
MAGKYGAGKGAQYRRGAARQGSRSGGRSTLSGIHAIRRAYRGALDDELTKLQNSPVRIFTPEEIAKMNAELKAKR